MKLRPYKVRGLAKKVKAVHLQNLMVPSAGYFKEFELFNSESVPNEFIFVAVRGKLKMSSPCFLYPAI